MSCSLSNAKSRSTGAANRYTLRIRLNVYVRTYNQNRLRPPTLGDRDFSRRTPKVSGPRRLRAAETEGASLSALPTNDVLMQILLGLNVLCVAQEASGRVLAEPF